MASHNTAMFIRKYQVEDRGWDCLKCFNNTSFRYTYCLNCDTANSIQKPKQKSKLVEDKHNNNSNKNNHINNHINNKCIVCLVDDISIAITTCGHFCFCDVCGFALDNCPLCRKKYNSNTDLLKIYT